MSTVPLFLSQSQAYLTSTPSAKPRFAGFTRKVESLGFAGALGLFAASVLVALAGA